MDPTEQTPDPPAYLVERISDLTYATKQASPSSARSILRKVISQLKEHNNSGRYLAPLERAETIFIDSPLRANALINIAIDIMKSEKEALDIERANPWRRILK